MSLPRAATTTRVLPLSHPLPSAPPHGLTQPQRLVLVSRTRSQVLHHLHLHLHQQQQPQTKQKRCKAQK